MPEEPDGYNYHDFCPLCGRRFKAVSEYRLIEMIVAHATPDASGESDCSRHFRPFVEVLSDKGEPV